ncbi:GNAT family N-acetyltransferase [Candidatus Bipolaricaulota bacterium]
MVARQRSYRYPEDFEAVGRFLGRAFPGGPHGNWHPSRWEYMHFHPLLDDRGLRDELERCGLWEQDDEIIGLVHFEDRMGVLYVQLDPRYPSLKANILPYAEKRLSGEFKIGKAVHVYIDDADDEFQSVAAARGFERMDPKHSEVTCRLKIPTPFPEIRVPEGFRLKSLADDFDVAKVHRVMHRGFNHEGEPPEDELEDRRRKLSAPSLRRDLTIVAEALDGEFVSFSGTWMDSAIPVCYVEPVATDPDYRRIGLGTAVVLEGIRRCAAEGATTAYVGSDQEFYKSMGFVECQSQSLWRKVLQPAERASP